MTAKDGGKTRYGLYVPNFGPAAYARTMAGLASDAEESGWDGFFLWDHLIDDKNRPVPMVDTFTALAAMAMATKRIRIGTTVAPLARRRPWLVARQTASIDHLSNGRLTLGVGLGFVAGDDYSRFGEVADNRVRAEKLDETLDIIVGLWSGKPFTYAGKHYQVRRTVFIPPAKQKPRIPIWVGGFWPNRRPFRRAARWDGVIPLVRPSKLPQPKDMRDILAYISEHRSSASPIDAAVIGWGTGKNHVKDRQKITSYIKAGMTWWLESLYRDSPEEMHKRILQGPPHI